MELGILTFVVLCGVWSDVAAVTVTIPPSSYKVARGESIKIPCNVVSKIKNPPQASYTWSAEEIDANGEPTDADKITLATTYYPSKFVDIKEEYKARLSAEVDFTTGKNNLVLKSAILADNMNFECSAAIAGDIDGQTTDYIRLIVLVAPSIPKCGIQGTVEYGQNINLTCRSDEGSPNPTYKWENRNVENVQRANPPRATDVGGVLSLFNISKETSGFYICTATNEVGAKSCNLTLAVMPPSMNIGGTAGIIGGAVALLIILVVIIYCCCCREKKEEPKYVPGEVRYESDRNGENRRPDGEVSIRPDMDTAARSERNYDDARSDYSDARSDYTDRRSDYTDRRSDKDDRRRKDYDDQRSDYDDRRSDFNDRRRDDDRRRDYDDRRSDIDDRRRDYDDRRDRYSDRNERYDDDRHHDDGRRYNDSRDQR